MFKKSSMSPAEALFIRTYISALRLQYHELQTAMHLMHPDNLSLSRFTDAARVVFDLREMHADFEHHLRRPARKNNMLQKVVASPVPTADQLADMVMLSFFKVVGVINETQGFTQTRAQGWFSGKPDEWHTFLTNLLKAQHATKTELADDLVTKCMKAIANLFHTPPGKKKWKLYPPASELKYDSSAEDYDSYFDDEDEDDDSFWS